MFPDFLPTVFPQHLLRGGRKNLLHTEKRTTVTELEDAHLEQLAAQKRGRLLLTRRLEGVGGLTWHVDVGERHLSCTARAISGKFGTSRRCSVQNERLLPNECAHRPPLQARTCPKPSPPLNSPPHKKLHVLSLCHQGSGESGCGNLRLKFICLPLHATASKGRTATRRYLSNLTYMAALSKASPPPQGVHPSSDSFARCLLASRRRNTLTAEPQRMSMDMDTAMAPAQHALGPPSKWAAGIQLSSGGLGTADPTSQPVRRSLNIGSRLTTEHRAAAPTVNLSTAPHSTTSARAEDATQGALIQGVRAPRPLRPTALSPTSWSAPWVSSPPLSRNRPSPSS